MFTSLFTSVNMIFVASVIFCLSPNSRITRKGSLQRLTSHYCDSIRENRLAAYKKDLEEQKVAFAKEKEALIRWIEKEEIELGNRK